MKTEFDPYRKWLGIPPSEQPPNHYRLLGIGLYETDKDVISNAADRQMAHIRTFQTGKHSELSQQILNELSAARVTLLDAKQRAAYDEKLHAELDEKPENAATVAAVKVVPVPVGGVAPPKPAAPPVAPPAAPQVAPAQVIPSVPAPVSANRAPLRKKKKDPTVMLAVLATVVIFLALLLFFAMQGGSQNGKGVSENGKGTSPKPSSSSASTPTPPAKPVVNDTPQPPPRAKPDNTQDAARKAEEMERMMTTPPEIDVEDSGMPGMETSEGASEEVTPEMLLYAGGGLFDSETVPGREHTPLLSMDQMDALEGTGDDSGSSPLVAPRRKLVAKSAGPRNGVQFAQLTGGLKGMDYRKAAAKDDALRNLYLKYYGGTDDSERANAAGLSWLDKNRGGFGGKYWDYNHAKLPNGKSRSSSKDPGTLEAPISATALTLLAMTGAGNSPKSGKMKNATADGLNYLLTVMKPVAPRDDMNSTDLRQYVAANPMCNLCLAERSSGPFHTHAWATIAFCEAAALTDAKAEKKKCETTATRLANHILSQQNADGGWPRVESTLNSRYFPNRKDNSSIEATVWNLLAMKAVADAQLSVEPRKFAQAKDEAVNYCRHQMDALGYRPNSTSMDDMNWTPAKLNQNGLKSMRDSLLGLKLAGKLTAGEESLLQGVCLLLMNLTPAVEDGLSNFLTALLARDVDPEGWEAWNEKLREMYIKSQEKDRAELGSWFYKLNKHEELEFGRFYCTVLAVLYLESYYRCPPMVAEPVAADAAVSKTTRRRQPMELP